jgi:hypothetical protein
VLAGVVDEEEVVGVELERVMLGGVLLLGPSDCNVDTVLLRGTAARRAVVYATGSAAAKVNEATVQQSVMMRGAMTRSFGAQHQSDPASIHLSMKWFLSREVSSNVRLFAGAYSRRIG